MPWGKLSYFECHCDGRWVLAHKTGHPKHWSLLTPALRYHGCPLALCATCHDGQSYGHNRWRVACVAVDD